MDAYVHGQKIGLSRLARIVLGIAAPDDLHQSAQRNGYAEGCHGQDDGVRAAGPEASVDSYVEEYCAGCDDRNRERKGEEQRVSKGKRSQSAAFDPCLR